MVIIIYSCLFIDAVAKSRHLKTNDVPLLNMNHSSNKDLYMTQQLWLQRKRNSIKTNWKVSPHHLLSFTFWLVFSGFNVIDHFDEINIMIFLEAQEKTFVTKYHKQKFDIGHEKESHNVNFWHKRLKLTLWNFS